ncbi:hypothetical protein [Cerasicoccus maritimus]|uniref:hypothetical protein n=1 Tax=Cerasicoccus maritimus TaxID=490089 RepID=UPI00285292AE|nr:hypothetical protein [Cerasicoccus maritimus]
MLSLECELKLLKQGTVAIDGTHLGANVSKDRNVNAERAQQLETRLTADIAAPCARSDQADNTDVNERVPANHVRGQ